MSKSSDLDGRFVRTATRAFQKVCEGINSPKALAAWILVEHQEFEQLLSLEANPLDYDDWNSFADDYLVASVFKKTGAIDVGRDKRSAALSSFFQGERDCKASNERIETFLRDPSADPEMLRIILAAQEVISRILGPLGARELDFAHRSMRFGPGATSVVTGAEVRLSKKYARVMHVPPRLYPYWRSLLPPVWKSSIERVDIRSYNKVTTVPKTWKTDRTIAIEPHFGIYYQLGFGALIRDKLLRFGLDLSDQTPNQEMARRAQADGLATIDLSNASNSISRELVWLLLPVDWAAALDLGRSEYGVLPCDVPEDLRVAGQPSDTVRYQMFSSMGNGYTFELESLLFLGVTLACSRERWMSQDVRVYGDDIICRAADAPFMLRALEFLGFKANPQKTFLAGRFFESCGADFFDGHPVRPFFWKGSHYDFEEAVIFLANSVRRYAHRRCSHLGCDRRFLPSWLYLFGRASDEGRRHRIPDGYGDGGFVSNWDEVTPPRHPHGWDSWLVRVRSFIPSKRPRDPLGGFVATLAGYATAQDEPLRGIGRYRSRRLSVYHWPTLGAWV